jgi:hypothetical protein
MIWKLFLVAGAMVIVGVVMVFVTVERYHRSGPPAQERQAREAAIQPLLRDHATRDEVVRALGLQFIDYSVGSSNRWVIEKQVSDARVRQLADQHPGVLFHTTMHWMTWLFFDVEGRLRNYYLCKQ